MAFFTTASRAAWRRMELAVCLCPANDRLIGYSTAEAMFSGIFSHHAKLSGHQDDYKRKMHSAQPTHLIFFGW